MKIAIDATPGELAARAGELLKAIAADLAPASAEARAVLEALEHAEDEARAARPMRDPKLEALRVQAAKVVGQELRALREDIEAQADDEIKKALYIGPKGGKWADPEHTIPWKGDAKAEAGEEKKIALRPHPRLNFRGDRMDFDVTEDGDNATLTVDGRKIRMPKASVQHFIDDLHGVVHGEPSGHKHIDAVLGGKAEFLGKGHEGLAFKSGDKVVKVSTTVPYHPENQGHRTPDEAARQVTGEALAAKQLRDLKIPHVPEMEIVRHGDKAFLIRDHVEIPEKLNEKQLGQVADTIHAMHDAGWALNDSIQVGVDAKGDVEFYDVGFAAPSSKDRQESDIGNLSRLYQDNGQTYDPSSRLAKSTPAVIEAFLKEHTSDKSIRMATFLVAKHLGSWEKKARAAFEALRGHVRRDYDDMPDVRDEELEDIDRREKAVFDKLDEQRKPRIEKSLDELEKGLGDWLKKRIAKTWQRIRARVFGVEGLTDAEREAIGPIPAGEEPVVEVAFRAERGSAEPLNDEEQLVLEAARERAGELITGLAERHGEDAARVLEDVRAEVGASIEARDVPKVLAANMREVSGDRMRDWDRVAVTELQAAKNEGRIAAIKRTSDVDDPIVYKIPAGDACFVAGTKVVTPDGEKPIEQIRVGDRVLTHKLRWRRVRRTFRRDYAGGIIGLDSAPNMTSNHPVLVDLDWRRADAVQAGDHVVELRVHRVDAENDPALLAEHGLLELVPSARGAAVVPRASVELHRYLQMRDGDIDVVWADRHFQNGREALQSLPETQGLGGRGAQRPLSSDGDSSASLGSDRELPRDACVLGPSRALLGGERSVQLGDGLGPLPERDVALGESRLHGASRHAERAGDLLQVRSTLVQPDQVIDVQGLLWVHHDARPRAVRNIVKTNFVGPVFNLEVEEDESYFAGGIAVHNCSHCARLHVGPDGLPRLFRLSTLDANNAGRKKADWRVVRGPVHPNCHPAGTLIDTRRGKVAIEDVRPGDYVVTHDGNARRVSHAWQSANTEPLIEIETADGRVVRATPNHPLLSDGEWKEAAAIEIGDDLVGVVVGHPLGSTAPLDPAPDDRPSARLQERRLLRVLGYLSGAGVPVPAIDFDGYLYRWEGYVDVHAEDRERDLADVSTRAERLINEAFVGRIEATGSTLRAGDLLFERCHPSPHSRVGGARVELPLLGRALRQVHAVRLGEAAGLTPGADDRVGDRLASVPDTLGYRLYREQIVEVELHAEVHVDRLAETDARLPHPGLDHADFDAESSGQVGTARTWVVVERGAEFVDGGARASHSHTVIVRKQLIPGPGQVYNLTVEVDHSYVANGIASHNCQCALATVPRGWGFDADGDLVPGGKLGTVYDGDDAITKALEDEDAIQRAALVGGAIDFQGIAITVEANAGDVRRWRCPTTGKAGRTVLRYAYGEIPGTLGADGDPLDVFVGPDPTSPNVYVVDQKRADGSFDEQKILIGFRHPNAAEAAYLAHYPREFMGALSELTIDDLRAQIANPDPDGLVKSSEYRRSTPRADRGWLLSGNVAPRNMGEVEKRTAPKLGHSAVLEMVERRQAQRDAGRAKVVSVVRVRNATAHVSRAKPERPRLADVERADRASRNLQTVENAAHQAQKGRRAREQSIRIPPSD